MVNIEINTTNNIPVVTTDEIETIPVKLNDELVVNRATPPTTTTTTTANRLSTKAAAAFSALDSTARKSFRAFGNKSSHQIAPSTLSTTTTELSKSDESLNNPIINSTKKTPTPNPSAPPHPPVHTSSKIANAASSAYSKLREFKSKRLPATTTTTTSETSSINKTRSSSDIGKILIMYLN